ncbi:MAG: aminoacyl-tRNA hydrolase [Muribaculaceae bacterium]|nr:aminoacyl-tRNA hydrolase [Muribaculaceae bacterium]
MKFLIVGLGNIGSEYQDTRHNVGFMIADRLVAEIGGSFKTERYGDVARRRLKNKMLIVLKPSTFMNLSGNAVRYWKEKENIELANILVLVDDIALPFGTIRIKPSGSDAGHNGLKNIASLLNTQNYPRLRFGVGNDFPKGCQIDYVLGKFSPEEQKELNGRLDVAVNAVKDFCLAGIQNAMCNYNNK